MMLAPSTRLGPYEIIEPLGAGGMGEVYRARDSKLGRDVAIKVLPPAFARDTDRMGRFEREAKVLALLSHPNIATIYGVEESGSTRGLVMELVEGPTLADRIRQGTTPVDEAVRIARQIADALEYAHEHGIIHRDLKPANVKVTNDDSVKVLDFSLAKALERDAFSIDISTSPTISQPATQAGILLGTAAYMSPEQAKGKPVDRRADIWAFGCVLYEMLTGKRAFDGETVTDTLAAIIKEEPDWSQLSSTTPVRVRVLLLRCMQKDPKQRLRDIGDARILLDEVLNGVPEPTLAATAQAVTSWRRALPWTLFGTALVVIAALAWAYLGVARTSTRSASVQRFDFTGPEQSPSLAQSFQGRVAILSPDGTMLLFFGSGTGGRTQLWMRKMDSLEAHALAGTEGATGFPFWSPDSRYVAFGDGRKFKKVNTASGSVENLCDSDVVLGGFWTPDGSVIFSQLTSTGPRLFAVPDSGGTAAPFLGVPPPSGDGGSISPLLLPDGKHFLYIRGERRRAGLAIYLASLTASASQQAAGKLLTHFSSSDFGPPAIVFAPSPDNPSLGYLLFTRWDGNGPGSLLAQTLDLRKLELTGEPVLVAEGVPHGGFSTSTTGALVYGSGGKLTRTEQLTLFDRQGRILGTSAESNDSMMFSPDGKRLAAARFLSQAHSANLWLTDLERGVSTRFTFDSGYAFAPVWSPDGSHIIFTSDRDGSYQLYKKLTNGGGEEELLFKSELGSPYPMSWSDDGRYLLYSERRGSEEADVFVLPLDGNGRPAGKPFLFAQPDVGISARFSTGPQGRPLWVAYCSRESGRYEVYVRPFDPASPNGTPAEGGKWQVSTQGGCSPRWNGSGKELFYVAPDDTLMSVEVRGAGVFQYGAPKPLFQPKGLIRKDYVYWDASADGKKFVFPVPSSSENGTAAPMRFTVVLNWPSLLKK